MKGFGFRFRPLQNETSSLHLPSAGWNNLTNTRSQTERTRMVEPPKMLTFDYLLHF